MRVVAKRGPERDATTVRAAGVAVNNGDPFGHLTREPDSGSDSASAQKRAADVNGHRKLDRRPLTALVDAPARRQGAARDRQRGADRRGIRS
jgi:hypothetical protein